MAIEVTPDDVDEQPQQATPSTPENSTIMPTDTNAEGINTTPRAPGPASLMADDVDTLPPGLMRKPAAPDPSQTMAVANPKGLVEPGTLPIWNRPTVQNADGSHSSELSFSREDEDGNEVLVPAVVNGKFMTPDGKMPPLGHEDRRGKYVPTPEEKAMQDRAWEHYEQTGEHLGKFKDTDSADAYAEILHNRGDAKSQTELSKPKAFAPFKSPSGNTHHFGQRVMVNGVTGTVIGQHPDSKKPFIHWDE
jgi:hypothetical protein